MKNVEFLYNVIGTLKTFKGLKNKILKIPREDWYEWQMRRVVEDQADSLTILLFNQPDKNSTIFYKWFENKKYLDLLKLEIEECISILEGALPGGDIKRAMLINLPAGCNVKKHYDVNYHLETCHRVHIPILTNDQVEFFCKDILIPMQEGTMVDFNNNHFHEVRNNSSVDRVHLVIDWGQKDDRFYLETEE